MPLPARLPLRAVRLLALALLAACGRGERPLQASAARWTLDAKPAVEIGRGEGEDALFRVTSAARLPDGRIAVANAGTQQVKLFGADGGHLASLGRRGGGPGEFQVPMWVGAHGDSLLVWDAAVERLTVYDAAGKLGRTTQFPAVGGSFPSVVGVFGDGALLLESGTDEGAAARAEGAWRGSTQLVRVSVDGRFADTMLTLPASERFAYRSGNGMGQVVEDLPFGKRTVIAVAPGGVMFGTGDAYRIQMIDTAGHARDLLRTAWTPQAVSARDVEDYWARMITVGSRSDAREAEAQRSRIPYPRNLPPYEALLADSAGALWIKDAQPPRGWDDPDLWRVYSAAGAPLATIELPARVRPQAVGHDWILCIALDAAQRETIRLYRFSRG